MKIVVLGGGISTERSVSLVTATSVCRALRDAGHKAIFVDMFLGLENYTGRLEDAFDAPDGFCGSVSISETAPDLEAVKASRRLKSSSHLGVGVLDICALADCVFLGLHGIDGEDGKIQAALELLGGYEVEWLGEKIDLTPGWRRLTMVDAVKEYAGIDFGAISDNAQAVAAAEAIGVELPDTREELAQTLERMLAYGNHVIVEKKIKGREIQVAVLAGRVLPSIEIIPSDGFYDYANKYQPGAAREVCPAPIPPAWEKAVGQAALTVYQALGLAVYARADFIVDEEGTPWFLEINTLPGMTPTSLVPQEAAAVGIGYEQLCQTIIDESLKARRG